MLFRSFGQRALSFVFGLTLVSLPAAGATFSENEIAEHRKSAAEIANAAGACLEAVYDDHIEFFERNGFSKYYGDRKEEHQTVEGRMAELAKIGIAPERVGELRPISCIGLTLKCLRVGFRKAGQEKLWNRILSDVKADGSKGTDLLVHLRALGWRTLYWNPNPEKNSVWDAEDAAREPAPKGKSANIVWGQHAKLYDSVLRRSVYQGVPIDDASTLVGFGEKPPTGFLATPFFVGIAHSGYHVFPGTEGRVIEAHSTRNLSSKKNLEFSPFNPLGPGGGPRWTAKERYRSGVIAVPPGY